MVTHFTVLVLTFILLENKERHWTIGLNKRCPGKKKKRSSITFATARGSCSLVVQCLLGMREVPGSNPLGGNILCSPNPSEETINRGPNTPIPIVVVVVVILGTA